MGYLRWILTQPNFDPVVLKYAKLKVGEINPKIDIEISGHAVDQFSLRYLELWQNREWNKLNIGLHRFVKEISVEALEKGKDISKKRHQEEGVIMLYQGIKFVFNPIADIRSLITVM